MLKESSTPTATTDSETVSIPREAWEVIRSQDASLEMKDKQMSEMLMMLKEHFGYPTMTCGSCHNHTKICRKEWI